MKRILLFIIPVFFLFSTTKAQFVTIPDANFAAYLEQQVPNCITGNQLDTTCDGVTYIHYINCFYKQISDLTGIQYFKGLRSLLCDSNELTFLPLLPPNLEFLSCRKNQLTALPAVPRIYYLDCTGNQITALPALYDSLHTLLCGENQLTIIPPMNRNMFGIHRFDVHDNPDLACMPLMNMFQNTAEMFDISGTKIKCMANDIQHFYPNPTIENTPICDLFNNPNGCAVGVGISGTVYFDANENCRYDAGDVPQRNVIVQLWQNGEKEQSIMTGDKGYYFFDALPGAYTLKLDTTGRTFDIICPFNGQQNAYITVDDSTSPGNNFAVKCKRGVDLGVFNISSYGIFRPASSQRIQITAGESSSFFGWPCALNASGKVTATISGPFQYNSSPLGTLTPTVTGNTLSWVVNNFSIIDITRAFDFNGTVSAGATAGEKVCITVTITDVVIAGGGAEDTLNNSYTNCFTVRTSYDPNDKTAYPEGNTDIDEKWLTYTIRFQNTGTDTAFHIYLMDTIDTHLNMASFQLQDASFQPTVQLFEPNIVRFNFPHINLPDSNVNEPLSHGFVQYRIRMKNNLPLGTEIRNTAHIYFDLNPPVATNTTLNTLAEPAGIVEKPIDMMQVYVYPNPANSQLTVTVNDFKANWLALYDISGKKISEHRFTANTMQLDIATLSSGIYFVEVKGHETSVRKKVVKE